MQNISSEVKEMGDAMFVYHDIISHAVTVQGKWRRGLPNVSYICYMFRCDVKQYGKILDGFV